MSWWLVSRRHSPDRVRRPAWTLALAALVLSPGCRDKVETQSPRVVRADAAPARLPVAVAGDEEPRAPDLAPGESESDPEAFTHSGAVSPPLPRPLRRCFDDRPSWRESPVPELLDEAARQFDAKEFAVALACAEEAARQAPRSVEAHHDRAVALVRLGRVADARDAVTLVLAMSPDDVEALELGAEIFINQLEPTAERASIGREYARRAARLLPRRDHERRARVALLEGQALIDLGQAAHALAPLDRAIAWQPRSTEPLYEKGVALFELARFAPARRQFERVLAKDDDHAHAHFHLALVQERMQDNAQEPTKDQSRPEDLARAHFERAAELDPVAFPLAPEVSPADFAERVRGVVARLPEDVRRDLADVTVDTAEMPALEDLVSESPPLSPSILGLFRGLPLGAEAEGITLDAPPATRAGKGRAIGAVAREPARDCLRGCAVLDRAIVLYRRNLLRSIPSVADLDDAILRTVLHEVGHLRGEDDGSLRDRGLE
jgi:tetratricopeptide (TPR) repeat protein